MALALCATLAGSADAATGATTEAGRSAALAGRATGVVIFRGATVVAPGQGPPRARMAIVVDGERIASIVPESELGAAELARASVVDVRGLYALPGLVDTHVHLATQPRRTYAEAELNRLIYAGVTSVRDMGGDARALADLSRAALINEIPAPDLYYSALVAGPEFFTDPRTVAASLGRTPGEVPWLMAITDTTDLSTAVTLARGTGASGLKIYADLPGPLVVRLIAEAKRQHFPVWTHSQVYPATPYDSLGATSVSHVCMIARYLLEPGKTRYGHANEPSYGGLSVGDPELVRYVQALAASGTIEDATLSVYPKATEQAAHRGRPGCTRELAGAIAGAMFKAGVPLSAGTDGGAGPLDPYPSLEGELASLVRYAGLTPEEALLAATRNGARALGLEAQFGSLEAGKDADILFVRKNPLTDIGNLRTVVLTVKRGHRYARSAYRARPVHDPSP